MPSHDLRRAVDARNPSYVREGMSRNSSSVVHKCDQQLLKKNQNKKTQKGLVGVFSGRLIAFASWYFDLRPDFKMNNSFLSLILLLLLLLYY